MQWAVEGGADYIIAETFNCVGEAKLALEAIKQYGKGNVFFIPLLPLQFLSFKMTCKFVNRLLLCCSCLFLLMHMTYCYN